MRDTRPNSDEGRRRSEGLTLLEVMVAMAMLAAGLLAMLTMQINALRGGQAGKNVTEASRIAHQQLEYMNTQAWANLPDSGGWQALAPINGGGNGAATALVLPQQYNVQWRVVQDPVNANLRALDVQVTWLNASDPPGFPQRVYAVSTFRHNEP